MKHGLPINTKEYRAWSDMKRRCHGKANFEDTANYQARGIQVAPEWREDYAAFLAHVGPAPSKTHSLDRIDNNGNYEPGNVRWATQVEQQNNRRSCRIVPYRGERMSISAAVRLAGNVVELHTAFYRVRAGWTIEKSVETPPVQSRRRSK